jgi:predicted oxidoreductase
MKRAFTNTDELLAEAQANLRQLHAAIEPTPEAEAAFAWLESFVAVSMRIIAKTNPSKVRDCARTEWIKGLIEGKEQING